MTNNSASRIPILGITMGDPAGIGPEVIVKALAGKAVHRLCRPLVIGSHPVLVNTVRSLGLRIDVIKYDDPRQVFPKAGQIAVLDPMEKPLGRFKMGRAAVRTGAASIAYVKKGVELAMAGSIGGIVTAPINKEGMNLAGFHYPGHTELLADLTASTEVGMMIVGGPLRIMFTTTHVAIRNLSEMLTTREAAIAAAFRGLEQDREAIRRVREEIGSQSDAVAGLAQTIVAQYRGMEEQAGRLFDQMLMEVLHCGAGCYRPRVGIADTSSITSIALAVHSTPITERELRHHKVVLAKFLIGEEWSAFADAAAQLETVLNEDDDARDTGILCQMIGHAQAGDVERAMDLYGRFSAPPAGKDGAAANPIDAKVMFYRALLEEAATPSYGSAAPHLALLDDLRWRFSGSADDPEIAEILKLADARLERQHDNHEVNPDEDRGEAISAPASPPATPR